MKEYRPTWSPCSTLEQEPGAQRGESEGTPTSGYRDQPVCRRWRSWGSSAGPASGPRTRNPSAGDRRWVRVDRRAGTIRPSHLRRAPSPPPGATGMREVLSAHPAGTLRRTGDPSTSDPIHSGQGLLHVLGCDRWIEYHRRRGRSASPGASNQPATQVPSGWGPTTLLVPSISTAPRSPGHSTAGRAPRSTRWRPCPPCPRGWRCPRDRGPHVRFDLPGIQHRRAHADGKETEPRRAAAGTPPVARS